MAIFELWLELFLHDIVRADTRGSRRDLYRSMLVVAQMLAMDLDPTPRIFLRWPPRRRARRLARSASPACAGRVQHVLVLRGREAVLGVPAAVSVRRPCGPRRPAARVNLSPVHRLMATFFPRAQPPVQFFFQCVMSDACFPGAVATVVAARSA